MLEIMLITHMPMDLLDTSIKGNLVITKETLARYGKPGRAGTESLETMAVAQTTLRNYLLLVGDSE